MPFKLAHANTPEATRLGACLHGVWDPGLVGHCRPRGLVLINPGNPTGKRYYGPFIAALNMARDFSSHFWWGTWQKKRDYPSKRGGLFKTIGATRGKPSHFKRGITETV